MAQRLAERAEGLQRPDGRASPDIEAEPRKRGDSTGEIVGGWHQPRRRGRPAQLMPINAKAIAL